MSTSDALSVALLYYYAYLSLAADQRHPFSQKQTRVLHRVMIFVRIV